MPDNRDRMVGKSPTLLFAVALLLLTDGVLGVQLVGDQMPQTVVVENGTSDAVVLDCPFQMEDGDEMEGMVIKWFYQDEMLPMYQWIPGEPIGPQVLESYRDRVDIEYRVDTGLGQAHTHRALKLLYPTTDLSGEYICRVSSFKNHQTQRRKLIVYSKPEVLEVRTVKVEVEVEGHMQEGVVVECEVERMYPQPHLSIVHHLSEGGRSQELTKLDLSTTNHEGLYSARAEGVVVDSTLDGTTVFWCNATVPETNLHFTNHTKYQPSMELNIGAATSGVAGRSSSVAALLTVTLLAFTRI